MTRQGKKLKYVVKGIHHQFGPWEEEFYDEDTAKDFAKSKEYSSFGVVIDVVEVRD